MNLGNKYKNLCWLKDQNFLVPAFVAILESDVLNKPSILNKIKLLKYPLAVRSSFAGEDGLSQSFAGLFESILNVQNESELFLAIAKVADSLKSDRVSEYCSFHKVMQPAFGSIVVQEMIQSKIAGVIFTQDPMNSQYLIISSAVGLGENLVSGLADSEDLLIHKINPEIKNQKILSAELQKLLFSTSLKIENLKKKPQDIEWAIDDQNQIFFLQTRDITISSIADKNSIYFDNSNIQESFIGVTLPLTFSYAKNAYRQSYNTLMQVMGFSHTEVASQDWRHQHMLGVVDGRVYYNINSWYEGLLYLPHFGHHKTDMENMMGLEKSIDFIKTQKLSRSQKLKAAPKMIQLLARMIFKFSRIKSEVEIFDQKFLDIQKAHRSENLKSKTVFELLNYLLKIQDDGFKMWATPLINDFYVMIYSGKVRRMLSSVGCEDQYPHLLKVLDLESFKPVLMLNEITEQLNRNTNLKSVLFADSNFFEICKKDDQALYEQILKFIDLYGDRVLGELKLETETYRTHPKLFLQTLKLFLNSEKNNQSAILNHDVAIPKMNFLKSRRFSSDLKKLQTGIKYRELMRFHRTRSFGMIREVYLELARKFSELKVIQSPKDIFYLTTDEIADLITFQNVQNNIQGLINLRKSEYASFDINRKYHQQIQMQFPMTDDNKFATIVDQQSFQGQKFHGTGCYPGILTGEICYVKDIADAQGLKGKILLAERTDPGWTPLFYLAKAVIVEKGSILSHAAIVAREVGIPIIIGVPQITRILKTGDIVTMNGKTGDIQVESR